MDQPNGLPDHELRPEEDEPKVDFTINESTLNSSDIQPTDMKKVHRKHRIKFLPKTKKGRLALLLVILVIAGVVYYVISQGHQSQDKITSLRTTNVAKSDLVPSTLSGLPVAPSVNKIPVTGVMIENSLDARPQAGLSKASVVFEAIAEAGITRFLALYQDTAPDNLGPIRSVRPYYIEWAMGFDASIAHVGGSPDALSDMTAWDVKNLDQFYNGNYYHRITSRAAPHNVYTSIAELNKLEENKGYLSASFSGFSRKSGKPVKSPTAANVNLAISSADYNVSYTYDKSTNSYNRSEGGQPMIDSNTGKQISPKVVIAIVVPETQGARDSSGAYYSDYNVIGSGTAYVFQNGSVTSGQWSKASRTAQIMFTAGNGKTIKLDPGQTWITALTSNSQLTYTP